ncbi:MAG: transporter [Terriglobales bacterium]
MKRLKRTFILGLALSIAPALYAKEGGDQYPNGAENWFAGATPPPGFYYVNYFGYYTGQLKNASGDKVSLNGTTPSVDAIFDAFRFLEMTHFKILGANYGMHVIIPVVNQSMNLNGRNSTSSLGDVTIDPFVLGWHRTQWHAVAAFDIDLPTGAYTQSDPRVSIGANYYSFEPVLALSYMPRSGWEASSKLMYNVKTTNQATNYRSGQEFHMDYLAGKHLGSWMFGGSGYFLKQVTDDTVNGQTMPDTPGLWDAGRRGQVFAVGPSAGYTSKRHMTFMAQWQHETLVCNRFGGDKVWFKMIIPAASFFHGPQQQATASRPRAEGSQ